MFYLQKKSSQPDAPLTPRAANKVPSGRTLSFDNVCGTSTSTSTKTRSASVSTSTLHRQPSSSSVHDVKVSSARTSLLPAHYDPGSYSATLPSRLRGQRSSSSLLSVHGHRQEVHELYHPSDVFLLPHEPPPPPPYEVMDMLSDDFSGKKRSSAKRSNSHRSASSGSCDVIQLPVQHSGSTSSRYCRLVYIMCIQNT